jgi:pimeloyl-ACP methyl ester carboxylesterase
MLEYAQVLHQASYSTLLFDFRGRGDSDGDAVTLGFYEQQDVLAAVEYLKNRDDVDMDRVGVLGISMGGVVAILAAAQEPAIKSVVADSPFESAEQAIEEGFTRVVGLPTFPFAPITLQFIKWRLGIPQRRNTQRLYCRHQSQTDTDNSWLGRHRGQLGQQRSPIRHCFRTQGTLAIARG